MESFPALSQQHVSGCKMYANRDFLIADHREVVGGIVAEVGVSFGDFSEFILKSLAPKKFVAIDTFSLHEEKEFGGKKTADYFCGLTHAEHYRRRFESYGDTVIVDQGFSHDRLSTYPDGFFNMIYVDAAHDYHSVKRDLDVAAKKLAPDGVIVCNDYIMTDHIINLPYGVVQAVNELVVGDRWRVVGFALQQQLFCDIAIKRSTT